MEFVGFTVNIGFLLLKFQQIFQSAANGKNNNFISILTNFASWNFRLMVSFALNLFIF